MQKTITLTGKVTAVYAKSRYVDSFSRIRVQFEKCGFLDDTLLFRNDAELQLDDVCFVTITAGSPEDMC
jgi:hypothetical protein